MTEQLKHCPQCGQIHHVQTGYCQVCGHTFSTRFQPPPPVNQTQLVQVPTQYPPQTAYPPPQHMQQPQPDAVPHYQQIVGMWVCFVFAILFGNASDPLMASGVAALASIGVAIYLVFQKSAIDKINGTIYLVLMGIGLMAVISSGPPPASTVPAAPPSASPFRRDQPASGIG